MRSNRIAPKTTHATKNKTRNKGQQQQQQPPEEETNKENGKNSHNNTNITRNDNGSGDETNKDASVAPRAETNTKSNSDDDDASNNITMQISVHRLSLDDPNFAHRDNWEAIPLPKLRQWVDAVYEIRRSDDKQYRLLSSTASMSMSMSMSSAAAETAEDPRDHVRAAWGLVFEECGFLRDGVSGERYRRELMQYG